MRLKRLADTGAIIPAAGRGKRMGDQGNKLFLEIAGIPVLVFALKTFDQSPWIREIVIPTAAPDIPIVQKMVEEYELRKVLRVIEGGRERQDSVFQALQYLSPDLKRVVVHDGARPLLTLASLHAFLDKAQNYEAAVMAVPLKDTIKKVDEQGLVVETPSRDSFRAVQTPQVFERFLLEKMHCIAAEEGRYASDDAALFDDKGYAVKVLEGSYENLKVTTPEDLLLAEMILHKRKEVKGDEGRFRL